MKKHVILITLILFFVGCKEKSSSSLVLTNVNIVNVKTGKNYKCNLQIIDGNISKVTKENLEGNNKIDLEGKYIMPSLWDMHVHLHGDKQKLNEFFKRGILGVRDLGAFGIKEVDSLVKWSNELENNPILEYPKIKYAGFINNDSTCFSGHKNISTYEDLIESANFLNKINSSYYKIHNCFPVELLENLDSLATQNDFIFGGHIPEGIDPFEYLSKFKNINSVEHIGIFIRALSYRKENPLNLIEAVALLDGPYLDSIAQTMKEKNISFTPNLVTEVEFIKSYPEDKKKLGEAYLKKLMNYTKRLSDKGVNILAGTDTGLDNIKAGESLYEELVLLSEAGISNLKVLQSTTMNADKANRKFPNLIEQNSKANLIILNDNPLENLSTLKSPFGIVHNGIFKKYH